MLPSTAFVQPVHCHPRKKTVHFLGLKLARASFTSLPQAGFPPFDLGWRQLGWITHQKIVMRLFLRGDPRSRKCKKNEATESSKDNSHHAQRYNKLDSQARDEKSKLGRRRRSTKEVVFVKCATTSRRGGARERELQASFTPARWPRGGPVLDRRRPRPR